MKKLLMITNSPICPIINGSRKRVYNLVKLFEKAGCEVQIVISNDKVGYLATKEQMCSNKIHFFDSDRKKTVGAVKRAEIREKLPIGILKIYSVPFLIDDAFPNGLDDFVAELHKKEHYDLAIVEYVYMSKALTKLDNQVIKIIDTHDVFAGRALMYYNMGTKPLNFYTNRYEERKGLLRADYVFAIQKEEARYFNKLLKGQRKVLTIGNYFQVTKLNDIVDKKSVLFVGSNNDPNREALNYFLNDIWKTVHRRMPDAEFLIAGDVSNSVIDSDEYIKVGYVEDLSDIYKKARVVINPMQSGTGLPIKSIEAMAYGKAMVMTESGARGLYKEGKEPQSFLLAKNTKDFIDKLLLLLNDDKVVIRLQNRCCKFVEKYNDKIFASLKKIVG